MSGLSAEARACFAAVDAMVPGSNLVAIAEREVRKAIEAALAEAANAIEAEQRSLDRAGRISFATGCYRAARIVRAGIPSP